MEKKYLIVISVGSKDYFYESDLFNKNRNYDIALNYYDSKNISREKYLREKSDYYSEFKYTWLLNFYYVLTNFENINQYKYIAKIDDDIIINYKNLNRLFEITDKENADISQPSFLDYNLTYKCFKNKENSSFRHTRFIETQFPVFKVDIILDQILKLIHEYLFNFHFQSGWGLDAVWSEKIGNKKIIVDGIKAKHMKRTNLGKGSYYQKNNINPFKEASIYCRKYNINGSLGRNGMWQPNNYFKKLRWYRP